MIRALQTYPHQATISEKRELSRIISAAVVNIHFRQELLRNPLHAVTQGFSGETFQLKEEQKNRLASIQAASLAEFAAQIAW